MEEGVIHENYYVRKTAIEILDDTLQTEPKFNVHQILQVLLKALGSDEYEVRLSAAIAIKNAIKANIITDGLIEDLGPFWQAARHNPENPYAHPLFGFTFEDHKYGITDEVASAHLHLMQKGELPQNQLPPENSFDSVSDEIRSAYSSRLNKVHNSESLNDYLNVISTKPEKRQAKAVKMTTEEIRAIEKMMGSSDQDQRIEAMTKLGNAIIHCSIDNSYIALIANELNSDEYPLQWEAIKVLAWIADRGPASLDLAKVLYQKFCAVDKTYGRNSWEKLLSALESVAKPGYIREEWLETFIAFYIDLKEEALENEELISGLPGYESADKLTTELIWGFKGKYGDIDRQKRHKYINAASNVEDAKKAMCTMVRILSNAAFNDVLNLASAQFLLREDIIEFFQNKPFQIEVYGRIAQQGFASPDLVENLLDFFENPPTYSGLFSRERTTRPEIVYALGQVYSGNPAFHKQVLPAINQAISNGYYEIVIKILTEELIPASELAPAILESFNTPYGISSVQTQLLGQLSTRYPVPTQYVKKLSITFLKNQNHTS